MSCIYERSQFTGTENSCQISTESNCGKGEDNEVHQSNFYNGFNRRAHLSPRNFYHDYRRASGIVPYKGDCGKCLGPQLVPNSILDKKVCHDNINNCGSGKPMTKFAISNVANIWPTSSITVQASNSWFSGCFCPAVNSPACSGNDWGDIFNPYYCDFNFEESQQRSYDDERNNGQNEDEQTCQDKKQSSQNEDTTNRQCPQCVSVQHSVTGGQVDENETEFEDNSQFQTELLKMDSSANPVIHNKIEIKVDWVDMLMNKIVPKDNHFYFYTSFYHEPLCGLLARTRMDEADKINTR